MSKQIGRCRFLIFFSESTGRLGNKLGRYVHWMVLYVYFVDPKCKYGARKVLSVLICGAFIFSSNPDEVFFILMFPIKLSLFSLLTDLFMALLFPIY